MSWLYLPEAVSGSGVGNCSDSEPSAMLKKTRTARRSLQPASATAILTTRRSGATCAVLRGAITNASVLSAALEKWLGGLSSQEAFPASRSLPPARWKESPTSGISGRRRYGSFARYDRASPSWKTYQVSFLILTLQLYSGIWPRAGTIVAGTAYRRLPWARLTRETASGLWPTPVSIDQRPGFFNTSTGEGSRPRPTLETMAKYNLWPTPRASERGQWQNSHGQKILTLTGSVKNWPTPTATEDKHYSNQRGNPTLSGAVRTWPTPTTKANRYTSQGSKEKYSSGPTLQEAVHRASPGGRLNPEWVEWLMGCPIGATALEPLDRGRFRQWLEQHGGY